MKHFNKEMIQKVLCVQEKRLARMLWMEKRKLWVPFVALALIACGYSIYLGMTFLITFSLDGLEAFALSFIPLLCLWCISIVSVFLVWTYFKKKAEFLITGLKKMLESF